MIVTKEKRYISIVNFKLNQVVHFNVAIVIFFEELLHYLNSNFKI